uniref:Uncharacterized protein n=1 Tax=Avena sativa TaxID=4498 RepID=A0ACD5U9M6_AVESA
MASVASDIDPAAEPQVVVEESSSAGGSEVDAPREDAAVEVVVEKEAAEGEAKEEEGECGFCLYMKAGGCEEAFVSWQQCVEAAEKEGSNMVERCAEATINLKNCMDAHADYYEPVLRVEKQVSDQAEVATAAATADADKIKVEESTSSPDTDETKKEEAVVDSTASPADAKEEVIEQAASSTAA